MSVRVETGRLTKGVVRARKAPSKLDLITPFTSQLVALRQHSNAETKAGVKPQKSTHNTNGNSNTTSSNNNNNNSSRNRSGIALYTARQSNSLSKSLQRDEGGSHPSSCPKGKRKGKVGLMYPLPARLMERSGVTSARRPVLKLARVHGYHAVAETMMASARTGLLGSPPSDMPEQQERLQPPLSPLLQGAGSNDAGSRWPQGHDVPSECSSLNSSITDISHAKDLLDSNEQQQQRQRPQRDEDDEEEETAQHCTEDGERMITARETGDDGGSSCETMEDLESKAAPKADSDAVHTPFSSDPHSNPFREWLRTRSRHDNIELARSLPNRSGSMERHSCPHGEHALPGELSDALCRSLSLYNAFFLDAKGKVWLVDDRVLARCLDYVGLVGYELPQDSRPKVSWNHLVSPLIGAASERPHPMTAGVRSCRWILSGKPHSSAERSSAPGLFLSAQEAERWLSEQEYVVGTILSCCARTGGWPTTTTANANATTFTSSASCVGDEVVPYLKPESHPILQAAAFVLERFPHWGVAANFVEVWERQVGLVIGTAAPSHQRLFRFEEDGIVFSSDMEGGNLARVERAKDAIHRLSFDLWMEPDYRCSQRLWFRFAIVGMRPKTPMCLRLVNIQPNTKLYLRNGMRPVWRAGSAMQQWTPVENCSYRTINNDADGELTFIITPRDSDVIHVAFCVPYTYADLLCHISHWHYLVKKSVHGIWFEERVLCHTQDGRKLHMLIITSSVSSPKQTGSKRCGNDGSAAAAAAAAVVSSTSTTISSSGGGARLPVVGPYVHFDKGKKVVLLSGRVHPGEVTASHGVHGAISFLLSRDPNAELIREHFVFYIVPMLNPDGVSRGHSRLDQHGFNLNRCYNNPDPRTQPTVNALRKVFEHLQQTFRDRFIMYMDFHSHASQSSGFMFGNHLPMTVQQWNMVFPKIVSLHAKDVFSYTLCRFGRGHMTSKEGSSRVLFGGSLTHSYTVELTHFSDNKMYVDDLCGDVDCSSAILGRSDGDEWEARYAKTQGRRWRTIDVGSPRDNVHMSNLRNRSTGHARQQQLLSPRCQYRSRRLVSMKQSLEAGSGCDTLNQIETPCILSQSAEVGRACLLALLDYCAVANSASLPFAAYGGMDRILREVKRNLSTTAAAKLVVQRQPFVCKQY